MLEGVVSIVQISLAVLLVWLMVKAIRRAWHVRANDPDVVAYFKEKHAQQDIEEKIARPLRELSSARLAQLKRLAAVLHLTEAGSREEREILDGIMAFHPTESELRQTAYRDSVSWERLSGLIREAAVREVAENTELLKNPHSKEQ